jgi:hypothetical protein
MVTGEDRELLLALFHDMREWWTPMGEYYAPDDGGKTYNDLTRRFFKILGLHAPDSLLECCEGDPEGKYGD